MAVEWDYRRERVRIFEVHLPAEPEFRIDNREILGARFVDPQALLAERDLPPYIHAYLAERAPLAGTPVPSLGGADRPPTAIRDYGI